MGGAGESIIGECRRTAETQNGHNFEPVEVTLGETASDKVEVKNGLFEGDRIVTQGAIQLYAQSLRVGSKKAEKHENLVERSIASAPEKQGLTLNFLSLPWWWAIPAGGAIAAGAFWAGGRSKPAPVETRHVTSPHSASETGSGEREIAGILHGEFCELPVIAEKNHHH